MSNRVVFSGIYWVLCSIVLNLVFYDPQQYGSGTTDIQLIIYYSLPCITGYH